MNAQALDVLDKALTVISRLVIYSEQSKATVQGVIRTFRGDVGPLIRGAVSRVLSQGEFEQAAVNVIVSEFPRAYLAGMATCGVLEMDDEDQAEVDAMVQTSINALQNFGDDLFSGKYDDNPRGAMARGELYANEINQLYAMGQASGCSNQMLEWQLGSTRLHCSDCLRLNRQRHRARTWDNRGMLPQSSDLECGGWRCRCRLVSTTGRATGNF